MKLSEVFFVSAIVILLISDKRRNNQNDAN